MGFCSRHAVYRLIDRLVAEGLVSKDPQGKLIPHTQNGGVPLLGIVEAGWPSPAEEELKDTITLDEYLIRNKEATYLLMVKGDSMIDAGIMPGDLLIVERGAAARDGDIVIAQIDREWTIKYFRRRGNKVFLRGGREELSADPPDGGAEHRRRRPRRRPPIRLRGIRHGSPSPYAPVVPPRHCAY